jgi:hypothetical protein
VSEIVTVRGFVVCVRVCVVVGVLREVVLECDGRGVGVLVTAALGVVVAGRGWLVGAVVVGSSGGGVGFWTTITVVVCGLFVALGGAAGVVCGVVGCACGRVAGLVRWWVIRVPVESGGCATCPPLALRAMAVPAATSATVAAPAM